MLSRRAPNGKRKPDNLSSHVPFAERLRVLQRGRRRVSLNEPPALKLEAIGRLAGGVAHDFNNLLTAIFGGVDEGKALLPPEHPGWQIFEDINMAARRAAALTRQLLTVAKHQVVRPKPLDLNAVLRDLERLLLRVTGDDITLELRSAEVLPLVRTDEGQMGQVVLNLVLNARDAMPHGGQVTIETQAVELDAEYATAHPGVTPGPYVMLAVRDTGVGIPPEVAAHIFEPFFTTKSVGRGTGLGLATSHGIVTEGKGHITFSSEVGQGTTFKVYLPQVTGEVRPVQVPSPAADARVAGTILVVEDEPMVRALTTRFLRAMGYTVLEARNGPAALAIVEDRGIEIDLIIAAMVMPEMGGLEMVGRLHGTRPNVRVLFVSAYTANVLGGLELDLNFLQKPFTRAELERAVRRTLASSG
jgi:two-component system cell cycle sensor histidine kinase/response regulator CckA